MTMTDQARPEPPFGLGGYTARELQQARGEYERAIGGKALAGVPPETIDMLRERLAAVLAEQQDRARYGSAILDRHAGGEHG
jgi:hypothetical protein